MIQYSDLSDSASGWHLNVLGLVYPVDLAGIRTLCLLGPAEPGFWAHFSQSSEYQDGQPDSMDRWSARVIGDLAGSLGGQAFFPFGGPPFQPFIRWAAASGRAWSSPVGLLVHDTAGLMISYRGAIGFAHHIVGPALPAKPCDSCADRPCETACPIGALGPAGYDVAACKAHLNSDAGQACMQGCLVRRACPVSGTYGRLAEHSHFHMKAFR